MSDFGYAGQYFMIIVCMNELIVGSIFLIKCMYLLIVDWNDKCSYSGMCAWMHGVYAFASNVRVVPDVVIEWGTCHKKETEYKGLVQVVVKGAYHYCEFRN